MERAGGIPSQNPRGSPPIPDLTVTIACRYPNGRSGGRPGSLCRRTNDFDAGRRRFDERWPRTRRLPSGIAVPDRDEIRSEAGRFQHSGSNRIEFA